MDKRYRQSSNDRVSAPSPRLAAFSILELLIVIGIMAILAAMTVAIGPGLLRSSAMSSSLSSVASAVSLARSDAIRSRKQTFFALAPDAGTLDERSFAAYAILRKEETNFRYVTPWKKLPTGVLFRPDAAASANQLPTVTNMPYPREDGTSQPMRVISFVSDGALDEDLHLQKSILPLQAGTRMTATDQPSYQGQYITNQILVERLSGKVKVEREGESPK
ncbi:MAG: type II secretion system protein [Terrimicrobiaceae bacterium]